MKQTILFIVCLSAFLSLPNTSDLRASQVTAETLNKMPLAFTKNLGQWDERVLFRANAGGATMWFTQEGVTYQFIRRIEKNGAGPLSIMESRLPEEDVEPESAEQLVITAKFVGANSNPEVAGEGLMEYKCNYFLGNDPSKWHADVPNYEAITLKDIYPGIDLRYSGDGSGQAMYEFIAAQDAEVAQIKVEYEGVEATSINTYGRLILRTKWGDMAAGIQPPAITRFSGVAGISRFSEESNGPEASGSNGKSLGNLAIGIVYSTFLGGGSGEVGSDISVDVSGNVFVTGTTYSVNFPTQNPVQPDQVGSDAFVAKLSSSGGNLIYSTYLGGGGTDNAASIAINSSGNAYVTGVTESANFPTLNSHLAYQGGNDVFVTVLSNAGNAMIYSTCLGGERNEWGYAIAVDISGGAYVTGYTYSHQFPTLNAYDATFDQFSDDAFVSKLSNEGDLVYSTYFGGNGNDRGYGIAVDVIGNAFVTGYTHSTDLPILNPYQTYRGANDVFVTKFSSSGNSLIYSTYLGGATYSEYGYGIAVDGNGSAYVAGYTSSSDFPTQNAHDASYNGGTDYGDAFVTKLSSLGNNLIYSTYLGGEGDDWATGIIVSLSGNAYVTGVTKSSNFPTVNPYQVDRGSDDAFVVKLPNSGNSLLYSTYLGGGSKDKSNSIAINGSGNAFVTGETWSADFPIQNAYDATCQNCGSYNGDAFITKLSGLQFLCGDADGTGTITISDAVFLINYIFAEGAVPDPIEAGDADGTGTLTISDAVFLIYYIFAEGPAPICP